VVGIFTIHVDGPPEVGLGTIKLGKVTILPLGAVYGSGKKQVDAVSQIYRCGNGLNLQVPWELQGMSTTSVTVTGNSIGTELESVPVALSDPGIFSLGAPQGGQGAIENVAGAVVNANSPAHPGDYILIFATGLGAVTPSPPTGVAAIASPLSRLYVYPTATIGGVPAPVYFAGLAPGFVGLYQVNVQVPPGVAPGDAVPVVLSVGTTASNTVTIAVR
jgi:uncharacterized protein (TIGR03437 family)